MKAVILCGGVGTRLRPLTYEIPKVLIPVGGKPVVEHILDLLKREGVEEAVLSIGYMRQKIRSHFAGRDLGISLSFIEEESPLGTAGPLRLLPPQREPFIVSNGDELKDINLREMLAAHRTTGALATIAVTAVQNPSLYGVPRLEGNRILEFIEKPAKPPANLVSAGLYILDPRVVDLIPPTFAMLEKDVFPRLASQGKLYAFPFNGQWFDTGSFERWETAIKSWKGLPAAADARH